MKTGNLNKPQKRTLCTEMEKLLKKLDAKSGEAIQIVQSTNCSGGSTGVTVETCSN